MTREEQQGGEGFEVQLQRPAGGEDGGTTLEWVRAVPAEPGCLIVHIGTQMQRLANNSSVPPATIHRVVLPADRARATDTAVYLLAGTRACGGTARLLHS